MTPRRGLPSGAPGTVPLLVATAVLLLVGADHLPGQAYELSAPSGQQLTVERDSVLSMLSRTRALYDTLESDPRIVYYVGYGRVVPEARPTAAFPWHAVTVRNDSAAEVVTPDNLREADRAYFNYAVVRMRERSAPPDSSTELSCRERVDREVRVLDAFADGWIVARALFGARAFLPLDEIPFARAAGHLEAYAVGRELPQLGDCVQTWEEDHPDRMEAYRRWRSEVFLAEPPDSASTAAAPQVHSLRR